MTATWTKWSSWNQCSQSCGSGQQRRSRSCTTPGDSSCPSGQSTETRLCNRQACPNSWSSWGQWSSCSPSCGSNRRSERKRVCMGDGECVGNSSQTKQCSTTICKSDSGMGEWSLWSVCPSNCRGYQSRSRQCLNRSLGCSASFFQFQTCSTRKCFSQTSRHHAMREKQAKQGIMGEIPGQDRIIGKLLQ